MGKSIDRKLIQLNIFVDFPVPKCARDTHTPTECFFIAEYSFIFIIFIFHFAQHDRCRGRIFVFCYIIVRLQFLPHINSVRVESIVCAVCMRWRSSRVDTAQHKDPFAALAAINSSANVVDSAIISILSMMKNLLHSLFDTTAEQAKRTHRSDETDNEFSETKI